MLELGKTGESQKAPEWLDIVWKDEVVEINGKGKIRRKK